jgi:hypothetical protein
MRSFHICLEDEATWQTSSTEPQRPFRSISPRARASARDVAPLTVRATAETADASARDVARRFLPDTDCVDRVVC